MATSLVNAITSPEATAPPFTHEDMKKIVDQMVLHQVMVFATAAERTTVFTALGITPNRGSMSYLQDTHRLELYDGGWQAAAGQLIKRHRRTTNSATSTGLVVGIIRLDSIPVIPGYAYRIVCPALSMTSNAGDAVQLTLRGSVSGAATTASTAFATVDRDIPSVTIFDGIDIEGEYFPSGTDSLLSVILCVQRISGGGAAGLGASATKPIDMKVYVDGLDPLATGVDL